MKNLEIKKAQKKLISIRLIKPVLLFKNFNKTYNLVLHYFYFSDATFLN